MLMYRYKNPNSQHIRFSKNRFIDPRRITPRLKTVTVKNNILDTLTMSTKIFGDALGTYVLMFCTLQWWWYKELNYRINKEKEDEDKSK